MNHNLQPINNTYSSSAYGLNVDLIGPCDAVICGFNLQLHDCAQDMIDLSGEIYIYSQVDGLNIKWFEGFKIRVNGELLETLSFTQCSPGIGAGAHAHAYDSLFGQWGSAYTLTFKAVRKPDLTPMDYAKALVEDKLRSSDPGVGAVYTREVMERVLADFLGSKLIEVTTNEPGCNPPADLPWKD